MSELEAEGYSVQTNGSTPAPLSSCQATDVHGTLDESATSEQKQNTTCSSTCRAPRTTETSAASGCGC